MKFLPLFPLGMVAFPGEKVKLHIFEQRYKDLINECYTENKTFGIVAYINDHLVEYGTEMKLDKIVKVYDDGKMDIQLQGTSVFRVLEFIEDVPDKKYSGGVVKYIQNEDDFRLSISEKTKDLVYELFELMELDNSKLMTIKKFDSYALGHHVGFNLQQEFELLRVEKESVRQKMIIEHLRKVIPVIKEAENLREKVKLNGHFKNLKPPFWSFLFITSNY